MRALRTLVISSAFLFATLLGLLAFVDNSSSVALKFLDWQTPSMSLYWWLLGTLVSGVAIGWLAASVTVVKAKYSERQAKRELTRVRDVADTSRS
jgi:uncharacterized integral membrane protein